MGGVNHQPTSSIRLIGPSAWLSQKVCEGLGAVLQANNELENAIIVAVDHLHVEVLAKHLNDTPSVYLGRALSLLETSNTKIDEIMEAYRHLVESAGREGYSGNPLASNLIGMGLAKEFAGDLVLPTVNNDAWTGVESRVAADNILKTLEWESAQFESLRLPTSQLIEVLRTALEIAEGQGNRHFLEAIEWNGIPLRQHYARVFSLWNHLYAMFMYSALMMTELFYRANGFRSLLEKGDDVADAAEHAA